MSISMYYTALLMLPLLQTTQTYQLYQLQIPNGNRVPSPCESGAIWYGVGHQSSQGANVRNPFGLDFKAAGYKWTVDLCRKDSDGDGRTNGQELGDPDCVWTPGATPAMTTGLSHPGICPLDSTSCVNSWTVCPKAFSCPALSAANVATRNFTINKNTPVPAKETTYMCQAFELNNTATPVHMIGSRPIIVNKNVMHHMIMYACQTRPRQALFDGPQECFMGNSDCTEILNLWAYGLEGECFNNNTGFRIGGEGYRYALLELHWNNPSKANSFTDSSGFSIYFTQNLRRFDQGTAMYGEVNLVLPPRQPLISFNHTCPSVCTSRYHSETHYITAATIHMHTFGIRGRISLWRNGTLIKDLSPLQIYDYNSPEMITFDPPIEYRRGDEVRTECYFSTLRNNETVFWGFGTGDEMCLSFLSYYPNNVSQTTAAKLGQCLAMSGINVCLLESGITPQIEQDCNISAMRSGEMPARVLAEMRNNSCFSRTGCDPVCRNYLNNTLWPSNACYDPKRARQMAEVLATGIATSSAVNQTIANTLYGQRFCEQEVSMLAELARQAAASAGATVAPTVQPAGSASNGLTSEHLLIVIIVCSCLGFILILAVLGLLASKVCSSGGGGGGSGSGSAKLKAAEPPNHGRTNMYKVYENTEQAYKATYDNPAQVYKAEL